MSKLDIHREKFLAKKPSKSPELAVSGIYGVKICEKQRFKILIFHILIK